MRETKGRGREADENDAEEERDDMKPPLSLSVIRLLRPKTNRKTERLMARRMIVRRELTELGS